MRRSTIENNHNIMEHRQPPQHGVIVPGEAISILLEFFQLVFSENSSYL